MTGNSLPPNVDALLARAAALLDRYREAGLKIVTAESCTGGLVAGYLTEIAGSSAVVERGFVVYSNEAKNESLGVPLALIAEYGAVSASVATALAEGALGHSRADVALAITGVAGPGGGSPEKPVGLVHFASARRGQPTLAVEKRYGPLSRAEIRLSAVQTAFELLESRL